MPLTPFHFGPGALLSVASPKYVSFLSFCAVNVLIDVESLYNMLTHQPRIHTFLHTYFGASVAAAAVIGLFIPVRRIVGHPRWPGVLSVAIGAYLGAWAHVVLDSIMHADITPLAPISQANPLYRVIPLNALHLACIASGVLALAWFVVRPGREDS